MTYIAGACQRQLEKEFLNHKSVRMCSGWTIPDPSWTQSRGNQHPTSYLMSRNNGGLHIPSKIVTRLASYCFKVFDDYVKSGLLGEQDAGPVIPLLTAVMLKKIVLRGVIVKCEISCQDCIDPSMQTVLQRCLMFYFRTFLSQACRTQNEIYTVTNARVDKSKNATRSQSQSKLIKMG